MGGERGRQAFKVLFLPYLISYWGPASLLPSLCPALLLTAVPGPAFSLFLELLLRNWERRKRGEKGLERSPSLAESGGGASVFNLEPTLECRDQQVTDAKTKAQRGSKICPKFVLYGSDRLGIRIHFFIMLATFSQNFKEIVITQSGILLSEIVISIEQFTAESFVIGENYDQSKSQ